MINPNKPVGPSEPPKGVHAKPSSPSLGHSPESQDFIGQSIGDLSQISPSGGLGVGIQKIKGLDDFIGKLDTNDVPAALKTVDSMLAVKSRMQPNMSINAILDLSQDLTDLQHKLTTQMHKMDDNELRNFAKELGNRMAQTDGNDEFLNTLLQQALDLVGSPRFHQIPLDPYPWRKNLPPHMVD